jgi:hypothetical protein
MRGVGAVVSADDEQHVHRFFEHVEQGVLAFLGGAAGGIEEVERGGVAIAVEHGPADAALAFLELLLGICFWGEAVE